MNSITWTQDEVEELVARWGLRESELTTKVEALEEESLFSMRRGNNAEADKGRLLAVIDEAEHAYNCAWLVSLQSTGKDNLAVCDCFKSKARMEE